MKFFEHQQMIMSDKQETAAEISINKNVKDQGAQKDTVLVSKGFLSRHWMKITNID